MTDNDKLEPAEPTLQKSIVRVRQDSTLPPMTHTHVLARTVINPPGQPNKDRTGPDEERFKDRNKPSKDKIGEIIKNNPIFDDKGKIKVPIDGGYEPRWRPGRDGKGGGGGGNGKAGKDPADVTYVEMSYEDFLKLFFEGMELPFLLRKLVTQTEVKTHKRRGITNNGPKPRLNKMETVKSRMKRAIIMKGAHPEDFCPNFEEQCQAVFESYLFYAAMASELDSVVEKPSYEVLDEAQFLLDVANAGQAQLANEMEFRAAVLLAASLYMTTNAEATGVSYKINSVVQERVEEYVREELRKGTEIPGVDEVPFHKSDMRYGRIEEKTEPDSNAAAFLILDTSGSMSGDPITIAKAFFFLNILFLRAKYKNVAIIMISHNAAATRHKDEKKYFQIEAGGGTVAVPAWKMCLEIAEAEYPSASWNRYMFQATDGELFDGENVIRDWYTKIVESPFNYCGYLETRRSSMSSWQEGGQALRQLKATVKEHVGMAQASKLNDVPQAFRDILEKDRVKN